MGLVWLLLFWPLVWGLVGSASLPSPLPSPWPSPWSSPEPILWPSFQPTPPPTPQPSACPCVVPTQEKGALMNLENFLVKSKVAGLRNFSDFLSCPSLVNHCSLNSRLDLNFTINSTTGDCFLSYFGASLSNPLVNTTGLFDALQNFGRLSGIDTRDFMAGTLPETIGILSSLTLFGIAERSVSGTIPSGLYRLTNLRFLNFASCYKLSGTISEEIGNLNKLTTLIISDTSISGTLPQELGRLTELTFLDASNNSLHGSIPTQFGLLSNLLTLNLLNNRFNASLPIHLPKSLVTIRLNQNEFKGPVPTQFGLLTNLTTLQLEKNSLSGSTFNLPPSLKSLNLYHNDFSGPCLPSIIFNLTSLTYLNLGVSTSLALSTIPLQLGTLTNLQSCWLGSCNFHGTIPDFWQNMTALEFLFAANNSLNSTLPNSLMSLKNLTSLNVGFNKISGTVELSCLVNLKEIGVNNNDFHGPYPQLKEPLERAWLSFNNFSGQLTSNLPKTLIYLNAKNNSLTGPFSQVYGLSHLTYLNLFGNHLTGTISTQLGSLSRLELLMIGANSLSSTIPTEIGLLSNLSFLNLRNAGLTGTLPSEIGSLTNLKVLNASGNSLTGPLPGELAKCTALEQISMYSNSLVGSIPSLVNLRQLRELLLSDNMLTGSIDFLFQNGSSFPKLEFIDISRNLLGPNLYVKSAPPQLKSLALYINCFSQEADLSGVCDSTVLESLLLDGLSNHFDCIDARFIWPQRKKLQKAWRNSAFGKLIGIDVNFSTYTNTKMQAVLPSCIFSMRKIQTVHAIANNLQGSLPDVPFLSPSLTRLRLSLNFLVGSIPAAFQIASGRMHILDLAKNRLKGSITHMLAPPANGTNALYLDRNRLSGIISSEVANSQLESISVLEGNLFYCARLGPGQERTDLPVHDEYYQSYKCGSQNLDTALYEFLGMFLAVALGLAFQMFVLDHFHRLRKLLTRNMFRVTEGVSRESHRGPSSEASGGGGEPSLTDHYSLGRDSTFAARLSLMPPKMRSPTALTNLTGKLRETVMDNFHANNYIFLLVDFRAICLFFGIAIVAFMLPLYAALKLSSNGEFSMYEKSYSWITSGAFLTGWEPATTLVVVWSFLLVAASMLFYHAFKRDSLSEREARLAQSAEDLLQRHADSLKCDGKKPRPPRALVVDEEVPSSRPNSTTIGRLVVQSTESFRDFLVSESSSPARDLLRQRTWIWARLVLRQSIIAFISCFISLTINISYVYFRQDLDSTYLYLLEFVVGLMKLIVRNLVPWLKRQRLLHFGISFSQLKFENALEVLLNVFGAIVAPFLATMITDKSCFFYYLSSPPPITVTYDLQSLGIKEVDFQSGSFHVKTIVRQEYITTNFMQTINYYGPFVYYYECSSSLIRAYAPPMISGAAIKIFVTTVVPFIIRVLLDWVTPWEEAADAAARESTDPSGAKAAAVDGDATVAAARAPSYGLRGRVRWWLLAYFPNMLRSEDEREEYALLNVGLNWDAWSLDKYLCASGNACIEYSFNLIDATGVLLDLFVDLLILLTFGLVCPLLALVQLLSLVLTCTRWQYAIESQLHSGDENDWDMVNLDCARAWRREKSTLYRLRWMLVTLPPLFLCIFIYDIAGDDKLKDGEDYAKHRPHVILTCFVALLPLLVSTLIGLFAPNLFKQLARRIVRGAVASNDLRGSTQREGGSLRPGSNSSSRSSSISQSSSSIWQRPNLGMQIPRRSTQHRRSSAIKNAAGGGGGGGGTARASAAGAKADADAEAQPVHNPLSKDAAQTGIELADIIPAPVEAEPEPEQAVVSSLSHSPPRRLRPDDNQQQI